MPHARRDGKIKKHDSQGGNGKLSMNDMSCENFHNALLFGQAWNIFSIPGVVWDIKILRQSFYAAPVTTDIFRIKPNYATERLPKPHPWTADSLNSGPSPEHHRLTACRQPSSPPRLKVVSPPVHPPRTRLQTGHGRQL